METKQITLRSQTKQCPHCGEYYSVTYKYCPFCDVGRKEEERRQAEKKKQRQAKLGGFFGGAPEKKKGNKPAGDRPRRETVEERPRREAPVERPRREHAEAEPARETVQRDHSPKASPKKKESIFFKKEARKKTSELTEEEKKARLADREARAAERKRLRDQAAKEAELAELAAVQAEPAAPVYETDTVPETFGYAEGAEPAVTVQPSGAVVVDQTAAQGTVQEPAPVQPVAQESEADSWAHLRELEAVPNASVVEVAGAGPVPTTVQTAPVAEPAPAPVAEPPVQTAPAQTAPVQTAQPEGPAAPVAEPAAPVQAQAQPQTDPQAATATENEGDLDALLSEIRDMLADSPVPRLRPDELKKPVQPVAQTEIVPDVLAEGGAYLAAEGVQPTAQEPAPAAEPVPAAEPAPVVDPAPAEAEIPAAPAVEEPPVAPAEEPTIVLPNLEDLPAEETPAQEVPVEASLDDQPTLILPHIQEEPAVEETHREAHAPVREKKARKETKKQKSKVLPVLLSLVVIIAAVAIVATQVFPTFRDGLFSQNEPKKPQAETIALNATDLSTQYEGKTAQLEATFGPEGSEGKITWASTDPKVASVDENGLVTAVGPGEATITATLENGESAKCIFRCTWGDQPAEPAEPEEPTQPEGPAISAANMTLDGEGVTKQLQVTGAEGTVKWSSDKTDVATVADDGTVTAVAKGAAVITAEVGGETFTCEVKCIW